MLLPGHQLCQDFNSRFSIMHNIASPLQFGDGPGPLDGPDSVLIDHIFASGFEFKAFKTEVAVRDDGSNRRVSDHRLIWAAVQIAV
jgi:hypothetical protein